MNRVKTAVIFLTFAIFAAACGQAGTDQTSNANKAVTNQNTAAATPAPSVDQAQFAKDIYAKNCMICHKDTGMGGKVTIDGKSLDPDDLTTAKMKEKADYKLASQISEGAPDDGMPAFKDKLSPDQIKAVVRHVRVLQGS